MTVKDAEEFIKVVLINVSEENLHIKDDKVYIYEKVVDIK